MALDVTKRAPELNVLVEIVLPDQTLRYATRDLAMSNGYYYAGRLEGAFGTLEEAAGSLTEPKQRPSTMVLSIINQDGDLDTIRESYTLAHKAATVLVGEGTSYSSYSTGFKGRIRASGGVRLNENRLELTIDDVRVGDNITLPAERYSTADYPNLDPDADGLPIPICYGDWTDGDQEVVGKCVDTVARRIKLCGHPIRSLGQVKNQGVVVTLVRADLVRATFELSAWASGNVVTAQCQGKFEGFTDEFTDGVIGSDWLATPRNGSIAETGGQLKITCPNGANCRWDATDKNAPTISCEVLPVPGSGDFSAAVLLESHTVNDLTDRGISLYQDMENAWRIGRYRQDGASVNGLRVTKIVGNVATENVATQTPFSTFPAWLRIERSGTNWLFRYSTNGFTWTTLHTVATGSLGIVPTRIVLYARGISTGTALIEAPFDDFMMETGVVETYRAVAEDLLLNYVGKAAADLEDAAFDAVETETANIKLRRFIEDEITSEELLEELGIECKVQLSVREGKYYPIMFLPSEGEIDAADLFDEDDILDNAGSDSFDTAIDPEGLYANRFVGYHRFNPAGTAGGDEQYEAAAVVESAAAQAEFGQVVEETLRFNWLYRSQDISDALNVFLFTRGSFLEELIARLGFRAILKNLGDVVKITYSRLSAIPFKVMEIIKHFSPDDAGGIVELRGFNVLSLTGQGHWTVDSPVFPSYLGGGAASPWDKNWTADQKAYAKRNFGYWHDADGYIDPTDPDSRMATKWAA